MTAQPHTKDRARPTPAQLRQAAIDVLVRLRAEGHEAYFVGGSVRDEHLGRTPREYDVATSAPPETVLGLFRKTVPLGIDFGVVLVVMQGVPVEVATFRADGVYVDGRRPTDVRYTTPQEDAERRDFTINGLFLDPLTGDVLDMVGGKADLDAGLIRAIGDPRERFREDRLRLLRAVRFASVLGFEIEAETWAAVRELAHTVEGVAWERVREELSRILVSGRATIGLQMLDQSGLLEHVIPELLAMKGVEQPPEFHPEGDVWVHTLLALESFDALPDDQRTVSLALAVLLHDIAKPATFERAERIRFDGHDKLGQEMTEAVLSRLRYPNALIAEVGGLVGQHMAFTQIHEWREAKLRRFLLADTADAHLALHRIDCEAAHGDVRTYEWCLRRRNEFKAERPPPPPLVSGHDLIAAGLRPGPELGKALAAVDDERLEGRVSTKEEALTWVLSRFSTEADSE